MVRLSYVLASVCLLACQTAAASESLSTTQTRRVFRREFTSPPSHAQRFVKAANQARQVNIADQIAEFLAAGGDPNDISNGTFFGNDTASTSTPVKDDSVSSTPVVSSTTVSKDEGTVGTPQSTFRSATTEPSVQDEPTSSPSSSATRSSTTTTSIFSSDDPIISISVDLPITPSSSPSSSRTIPASTDEDPSSSSTRATSSTDSESDGVGITISVAPPSSKSSDTDSDAGPTTTTTRPRPTSSDLDTDSGIVVEPPSSSDQPTSRTTRTSTDDEPTSTPDAPDSTTTRATSRTSSTRSDGISVDPPSSRDDTPTSKSTDSDSSSTTDDPTSSSTRPRPTSSSDDGVSISIGPAPTSRSSSTSDDDEESSTTTSSRSRTTSNDDSATSSDGGITVSNGPPSSSRSSTSETEPTQTSTRTRTSETEPPSSQTDTQESSTPEPSTRTRSSNSEQSSVVSTGTVLLPGLPPITSNGTASDFSSRSESSRVTRPTSSFSGNFTSSDTDSGVDAGPTSSSSSTSLASSNTRVPSSSNGPIGGNSTDTGSSQTLITRPANSTAAGPTSLAAGSSPTSAPSNANNATQISSSSSSESSDSSDSESSSSSSRTSSSSNYYDFVPSTTLLGNTRSITSTSTTSSSSVPSAEIATGAKAAEQSISTISISNALPASEPAKIVPGDATMVAPENTTLVSVLFTNEKLGWSWVVANPDTAAQILGYMPPLLSAAVGLDPATIKTSALVAYEPVSSTSSADLLTVYLAYIPSSEVDNLQTQIRTPTSGLYTQSTGLLRNLAENIDPALPLMAFTSTEQATIGGGSGGSDSAASSGKTKKNTTVIAIIASFGSVIAVLAAIAAFRYLRHKKAQAASGTAGGLRPLRLSDNAPQLSPPMSARSGLSGIFQSHHFASAQRPISGASQQSSDSNDQSRYPSQNPSRAISWYSGRYTDFGDDDENPRSRSVYGVAVGEDPFADADGQGSAGSDPRWRDQREEGVRRLKTGQVQISRPQLEGNSLML